MVPKSPSCAPISPIKSGSSRVPLQFPSAPLQFPSGIDETRGAGGGGDAGSVGGGGGGGSLGEEGRRRHCCCKGTEGRNSERRSCAGDAARAQKDLRRHCTGRVQQWQKELPLLNPRLPSSPAPPHPWGSFPQRLHQAGVKALVVARCLIHGCILKLWIRHHRSDKKSGEVKGEAAKPISRHKSPKVQQERRAAAVAWLVATLPHYFFSS
ncbi:hypothetical protein SEVIR_3G191701v4 [Setaria viridis]